MKLNINNTLSLISCLSSLLITSSTASSLRGDRHLNSDRGTYSIANGGGAGSAGRAGGAGRSGGASALGSIHDMISSIVAAADPFPSDLVTGTGDALFLGYSVSSAGDVNGDGIDDVIVGAPHKDFDAQHQRVGAAFVIFGQQGVLPDLGSIDLLDGTNGFAVYGSFIEDTVGFSVSHAGDINGDGIADVIIGAPGVDEYGVAGSGQAFVIFGRDSGFPAVVDIASLDGSNGFIIQGNSLQDYLGSSVSAAGDFNGDGIDDIIVGSPNADTFELASGGEAYVIFGTTSPFPEVLFITDLDGSNGFIIEPEDEDGILGRSVAAAGDVNGDGIDDILVGALRGSNPTNGNQTGATYVIYGTSEVFPAGFEVSSLNGVNGYKIYGTSAFDEFGFSLSALGDVNGDGVDDFVVGCPTCRNPDNSQFHQGAGYVFYGTTGEQRAAIDAATAGSILWGEEAFDGLGADVASAGDVNGDGINDIVVGAARSIGEGKNAILCIIYGKSSDLQTSLTYNDIGDTDIGHIVNVFSDDYAGKNDRIISVANAGDFNGDGTQDLIIGLPDVDPDVDNGILFDDAEGHVKILLVNQVQF